MGRAQVLVALTGGTIGSGVRDEHVGPSARADAALIEGFKAAHPDSEVEFDTIRPVEILRENATPAV